MNWLRFVLKTNCLLRCVARWRFEMWLSDFSEGFWKIEFEPWWIMTSNLCEGFGQIGYDWKAITVLLISICEHSINSVVKGRGGQNFWPPYRKIFLTANRYSLYVWQAVAKAIGANCAAKCATITIQATCQMASGTLFSVYLGTKHHSKTARAGGMDTATSGDSQDALSVSAVNLQVKNNIILL